ncbi:MAG: 2-phospho-L-lactate transferase [Chloroflexi bacterium]|nr:2-phospho-L-lactate transferase [Chloroflexota bacterium]
MRVVALAGGVGGARLAEGLQAALPPGDLTVVANTGDDTERHGLLVCPDHDTVLYTLAGIADPVQGWGIAGESWAVMERLGVLGEETWFRLGDRDMATHIVRTARLRAGARLTDASLAIQAALGVPSRILPMTDDAVRTRVLTDEGWLEFQDYFVRLRQLPEVRAVRFDGVDVAEPTPEVLDAVDAAEVVVLCPSNPIVSVAPILAIRGIRDAIRAARGRGAPVAAVSPIVGGKALKGPADRMLASLGHEVSAVGVARLYAGMVDVFVLDAEDAALAPDVEALGMRALVTDTIMTDGDARVRVARETLAALAAIA